MAEDPIYLFNEWHQEESASAKIKLPGACCLSSNGIDSYPNARMVSLKAVRAGEFIITGSMDSRKGKEIATSNKVALTFWWPHTQRQVRIQGVANMISNQLADQYFSERSRESQIVSNVSKQGMDLESVDSLMNEFSSFETNLDKNTAINRPQDWGGFAIEPARIEFMEFKETRFHDRTLFEKLNGAWKSYKLQP